jgi:hypothetical protein
MTTRLVFYSLLNSLCTCPLFVRFAIHTPCRKSTFSPCTTMIPLPMILQSNSHQSDNLGKPRFLQVRTVSHVRKHTIQQIQKANVFLVTAHPDSYPYTCIQKKQITTVQKIHKHPIPWFKLRATCG